MNNRKIDFMPKSRSGKWAVGLGIILVALMAFELFPVKYF
jgi:hypothetical protein